MSDLNLELITPLISSLAISDEFSNLCATKFHLHEEIQTWANRIQRETTAAFHYLKNDFDTWRTDRNNKVDPYALLYITPMIKRVNDNRTYDYYTWGRLVNGNYLKRSGKKGVWRPREIPRRGKQFTKNDFKRALNAANYDCMEKILEAEHVMRFLRMQSELVSKMYVVSRAIRPKTELQELLGKDGVNDSTNADLERLNELKDQIENGQNNFDPLGLPKEQKLVTFAEQNSKLLENTSYDEF